MPVFLCRSPQSKLRKIAQRLYDNDMQKSKAKAPEANLKDCDALWRII